MDFFDELISQLQKEANKRDSFIVSPAEWEAFLDPSKAVKKIELEMKKTVAENVQNVEVQTAASFFDLADLQKNIIECRGCPLAKVRKNPAVSYGDGSKAWGWFAVGFQLFVGYVLALSVYQLGMLFAGGVFGVWTVVAIAADIFCIWAVTRKSKA